MPLNESLIRRAYPGTVVYPPGGTFGPRVQADIQFVLLHTGHMRVDIEGETLEAQPGQVALLLPGRTEMFTFAADRSSWHRWISVAVRDLPPDAKAALEALPRVLPLTEPFNRLTDLMLSLADMRQLSDPISAALGLAAIRLYAAAAAERLPGAKAVHESVLAAKDAIHRRFGESLTLSALAQAAGVTPEHLVRLFRKHEQMTPMQYLWRYRVLAACDLLAHTGLTIGEIAYRCGFKTSYHFSRVVKAHTGMTPTAIRRERWSGKAPEHFR